MHNGDACLKAWCEPNLSSPILATVFLLHSPEGAIRPVLCSRIGKVSMVFLLHSPEGARQHDRSRSVVLAWNCKFSQPLLIWHPRLGWPLSNLWESFTDPETRVFQVADGEDLVILACTVFDWSTRVTDRRMDEQTELRWLRRTAAVAAVACKNYITAWWK